MTVPLPKKKKVGIFLSLPIAYLIYNLKLKFKKGIMQKEFLRVKALTSWNGTQTIRTIKMASKAENT